MMLKSTVTASLLSGCANLCDLGEIATANCHCITLDPPGISNNVKKGEFCPDLPLEGTGSATESVEMTNADPCPVGAEACACTPEGACDPGLMCLSDLCVDAGCPVGGEGCACTEGGGCDPGLECLSDICVDGSVDDGSGEGGGDGGSSSSSGPSTSGATSDGMSSSDSTTSADQGGNESTSA